MEKTDKHMNHEKLVIYGHEFCPSARRLRTTLDEKKLPYEWRDVRQGEAHFQKELKELAGGYLSVPTVIFPDGTLMVEPLLSEVLEKIDA